MNFFDYLFYKVYKFYERIFKETHSEIYSAGLVSLLQLFNVMSILYYIPKLNLKNLERVEIIGILGLFILLLNFIRYYSEKKHKKIINRFDNEKTSKKKTLGVIAIIYSILTIAFYILSLIYMSK